MNPKEALKQLQTEKAERTARIIAETATGPFFWVWDKGGDRDGPENWESWPARPQINEYFRMRQHKLTVEVQLVLSYLEKVQIGSMEADCGCTFHSDKIPGCSHDKLRKAIDDMINVMGAIKC